METNLTKKHRDEQERGKHTVKKKVKNTLKESSGRTEE